MEETLISTSGITDSIFLKHSEFVYNPVSNTNSLWPQVPSVRNLPFINRFLPAIDEREALIEKLLEKQKAATNYQRWSEVCMELDHLYGNDLWRQDPKSDLYNSELIQNLLNQMRSARLSKDYKLLLYLVRTSWTRNLGNMGTVNLYKHSFYGTKHLIEEYIQECELALDYLVNDPSVHLNKRYLLGMLIQTRKNIGRTALVLSGGSTFGIFHIGVLAQLLESNLMPRIVSGSSAGSIMASILCCLTNDEMLALLDTIADRKFSIFGGDENDDDDGNDKNSDPSLNRSKTHNNTFYKHSSLRRLAHFLKYGTLFDNRGLKNTITDFIGELTFREAYNRTGKILNITVSPASIHEQTRLINYLTAPNCLIWSVVCASCSVPGIFPSASIYEKNLKTGLPQEWNNDTSVKYVDGSVDNDLPITRLSEMFNVDHIIAVQVNPHVVPFLKLLVTQVGGEVESTFRSRIRNILSNFYDFMSGEAVHYLEVLHECGIWQNLTAKLIAILSQQYSGDITILPDFNIHDLTKIFSNPTPEFLLECVVRGARASWPKIALIKNHCGVEFALDKAITTLRGEIISTTNTSKDIKSVAIAPTVSIISASNDYTLVSSPVINDNQIEKDSSKPPPENGTNLPPNMKRHNTTGITNVRVTKTDHMKHAPKRNSISFTAEDEPNGISHTATINPSFPSSNSKIRGKSTTSLFNLKKNVEWTPGRNDFHGSIPYSEPSSNSKGLYEAKRENFFDEPEGSSSLDLENELSPYINIDHNIRKAKSSGNFYEKLGDEHNLYNTHQLKYESERIPHYKDNPYIEHHSPPPSSSKYYCGNTSPRNFIGHQSANLPSKRGSASSSLKNSFIGLNRLKDYSNNSSYSNLKELFDEESYQKQIMNLTSPDIRRKYRGKKFTLSRHNSGEIPLLMNKLNKEKNKRDLESCGDSSEEYKLEKESSDSSKSDFVTDNEVDVHNSCDTESLDNGSQNVPQNPIDSK